MSDFFIVIPTIRKYVIALNRLIESIPENHKYIIIYQGEEKESYEVLPNGNIEMSIKHNIYEYGNYIGVNILIENNIVSVDSWFLFIHDTCKFHNDSIQLTRDIIDKYNSTDIDIIWLSPNGQCNLCLIRHNGIKAGYNIYKNELIMDKMAAIHGEWNNNTLSPKKMNIKQEFIQISQQHMGKKDVYGTNIIRDVLLFKSINIEKYYFDINTSADHPVNP